MKTVHFGNLAIGEIPRVVGTFSSLESLARFPSASERGCDIVEARLDALGIKGEWLVPCQAIEGAGVPVIMTLRSTVEGGKWSGPDEEREAIFKAALPHISAVDIELRSSAFASLCELANRNSKPIVASYHDFSKTPAYDELVEVISDASPRAGVVKISTMVHSEDDVRVLQRLLTGDWDKPLCVIGMGSQGTHTRTSFPGLGSCLTYGYLDVPSAPGQLPAAALVEHLRRVNSRYNEEFIPGARGRPGQSLWT